MQYLEAKIYAIKAKATAKVATFGVTFVLTINDKHVCVLWYLIDRLFFLHLKVAWSLKASSVVKTISAVNL